MLAQSQVHWLTQPLGWIPLSPFNLVENHLFPKITCLNKIWRRWANRRYWYWAFSLHLHHCWWMCELSHLKWGLGNTACILYQPANRIVNLTLLQLCLYDANTNTWWLSLCFSSVSPSQQRTAGHVEVRRNVRRGWRSSRVLRQTHGSDWGQLFLGCFR